MGTGHSLAGNHSRKPASSMSSFSLPVYERDAVSEEHVEHLPDHLRRIDDVLQHLGADAGAIAAALGAILIEFHVRHAELTESQVPNERAAALGSMTVTPRAP